MAGDIRNFFNRANGGSKPSKPVSKKRIINDSDEEAETESVAATRSSLGAKENPVPNVKTTDPQTFFSDAKPTRTRSKRTNVAHTSPVKEAPHDLESEIESMNSKSHVLSVEGIDTPRLDSTASSRTRAETTSNKRKELDAGENESKIESSATSPRKRPKVDELETKNMASHGTMSNVSNLKTKGKEHKSQGAEDIIASIPIVELPEVGEPVQFKYGQAPPAVAAPGSKEIPEGAEGCLSGLNFVFTGVLQSLERNEAQDLVKKYGGKVTTAPSKNTSFVVLGEQAGPKKIEKIGKLGVKTIDENGLLQLIASMPAQGGDNLAAQKAVEKRAIEEKKAREVADEMIALEARQAKALEKQAKSAISNGQNIKIENAKDQLWTTKYAPKSMKDVIGNKANVSRLQQFLDDWPKNLKANFKKPGPEGLGLYRAVLISGPPGVGKTTTAHLVANLAGFDVLEFNASDTRSKRLLDEGLAGVVNNTSLNGYFGTGTDKVDPKKKRLVLIMDEVDGMSSGDRGGVGALNSVIRKSTIPIICICNDRSAKKLKPLERTTFDLRFAKPTKEQIRSRIMSIAYKEGLSVSPTALDQLVDGTGSDIRQIINLLSTYRLTMSAMNQDEGRAGAKSAEKHVILKPWDIVGKLLNGAIYNDRSKVSLNEKIELYFNDHELSYLMLQENYLNTNPDRARGAGGHKEQEYKKLELIARSASGISDGDLVDNMIRGQQQWSLMPVHAVFSCIRPASFVAGPGAGRFGFTSVLGNMSKVNKANRLLREIRAHLRLKTSGDRLEIRRDYIPVLFDRLPKALELGGVAAISDIISTMDEYFLNKDDYDSILELGIGENNKDAIEARIPSQTKAGFTRQYNKASHPVAFVQTTSGAPPKKIAAQDLPDFEDAVDLSDDDDLPLVKEEQGSDDEDLAVKNDKLIQETKKRGTQKASKVTKKAKPGTSKK